jgi:hypothetical protein
VLAVASYQAKQIFVFELVSLSTGDVCKAHFGIMRETLLFLFDQNRITLIDQLLPRHSFLVKRMELLVHLLSNLSCLIVKILKELTKHLVVECGLIR